DATGTAGPAAAAPTRTAPGPRTPETTADHPSAAGAGAVLGGKYKLVEPIGEGGMGAVWMARQTEPVRRPVAVKLIREGMDSRAVLARFEAERQALALMDHPHIAKVHDAGATPDGRPYFVMELVKGVPITKFCDDRKLTPRERLELFVPVCQAVQHAHQKGVIHRDIKPNNVLVALYDDRPVPKVIDFGVAKAAGQPLTDKTLMTGFGAVVGTPEYMSPEQAGFNQLDVDTRSDIYALGVLLYELLTGTTPVDRRSLGKAALLEVLRIVREVDPPRPSQKLSTADALPTIAANRHTEPRRLAALVKGDLDWIVMKALEKDRTRRYETANGLAADVQRYLAGEAVQAAPPSRAYRVRTFVRRHRAAVTAAGLVAAALVLGIAGTTWGLVEARRQRDAADVARQAEADRAEGERVAREAAERAAAAEMAAREQAVRERDAKERQRQYAQAIADFVQNDFFALTSVEGQGRFGGAGEFVLTKDTALRQLLDRGAEKLKGRTDQDPRTEADLCWMIGVNYRGVGEYKRAVEFLERAYRVRQAALGADDEEALNAGNSLAVAYAAAGRAADAVALHERLRDAQTAKLGPDHPRTLVAMSNLAEAYRTAGEFGKAVPLYEQTLALKKVVLGAEHPSTLISMNNLAVVYRAASEHGKAVPLLEETLALQKAKLGPDHPRTRSSP
ncbi:MAG: serine/threonine-protein kinase, partial [Gemmataceae bacterium]|nr:serine/threonine-protein kinase [Gemmataceae bacterium]